MRIQCGRWAVGWAEGPYLHFDRRGSTVVSIARLYYRQFGLRTWVIPHLYVSNAQIRFEWGLLEIHRIRGW